MLTGVAPRRASGLLLLLGASAAGACGAAPPAPGAPPAPVTDSCPLETPEQWQQFLERYAGDARWVATCEDKPCDPEYSRIVEDEIEGVFARCEGFLARRPRLALCAARLRDFAPTFLEQHSEDSYGFTVDNHAYLAGQESADRPRGMMRPPPQLAAALPLRANLEDAARQNGWKYLTHDSALGGMRTFVFLPDPEGRFDQWMLLNFVEKDQPAIDPGTPMSFIAVQKKDAAGRELPRVKLHFRDYNLAPARGGYELRLLEDRNGKCYSCHASGMRQLIPRRAQVLDGAPVKGEPGYDPSGRTVPVDFASGRLDELNARIRSYGMPDWEGLIVPERHGPALGGALGCTVCHDGSTRGVLTVSTSVRQIEQKIHDELSMPPSSGLVPLLERSERERTPLPPRDRRALEAAFAAHEGINRAFDASRLPELRRWLLERPCQ